MYVSNIRTNPHANRMIISIKSGQDAYKKIGSTVQNVRVLKLHA